MERKSIGASPLAANARLIKPILLIAFLCALSHETLSQKLTTTVELPKYKWSLEEVLTYLSHHYNVQFSYVKENIGTTDTVVLPDKLPLNELIIEISKQAHLEFRLLGNQFVLRKNRNLFPDTRGEIVLIDIKGTITDSSTHLPLPHANVYLSHTTFGTATDENGTFLLKNIPVGKYEFIFSHLGYRTLIYPLTLKTDRHLQFAVKLLPIAKELESVIITPERDKTQQKNFDLFTRELFGNTTNSRLCSILNPDVVKLTKTENALLAEASEPIEIENRALGYKIYLTLKKFVVERENYYLESNSRFEPLQPTSNAEQLRWELNRLNSYAGSEMHLFRSILDHRSWSEGFSIYKQNGNAVLNFSEGYLVATSSYTVPFNDKPIALDPKDDLAVVFDQGKYLITYEKKMLSQNQQTVKGAPYATSIIEVNSATLKVDSRGATILPHDYIRKGFINTHRIADKLPANYDPEKSRKKLYAHRLNKVRFIEGTVIDSITKKPISGADVFINFSTRYTKTDRDGKFRLQEIEEGLNDVVVSKFNYTIKHYTLIADSIQGLMNTFVLSKKPFHQTKTTREHQQLSDNTRAAVREAEISKFKKYLHSTQNILNEQQVTVRIDEQNSSYYDSYLPLEIIDHKLGYRINIFLEKGHSVSRGRSNNFTSSPNASCYFENIDTLFENQHTELTRLEAYEGSLLHFSKSLRYGRWIEEGFSIYKNISSASFNPKKHLSKKEREEIFPANVVETKGTGDTVDLPDWIEVHYSLPTSTAARIFRLHIPDKRILFSPNGLMYTNVTEVTSGGRTSDHKMIPMLPIDYMPPKEFSLNSF